MNTPENSAARTRWRELIDRHLLGELSPDEARELEGALSAYRQAREDFRRRCNLDAALRQEAAALEQDEAAEFSPRAKIIPAWFPWFSFRPLTAAAAGIVLGVLCTSAVVAYVAPSFGNVLTLLDDSFESAPAPRVTGPPVEPGQWSGDYTEVVSEQQGVKPASGQKMLRFLRTDYEGKPSARGNHVADLYRLIDVRPYRDQFADGLAVVQLSAGFNASEIPPREPCWGRVGILAFNAETITNSSLHTVRAWEEHCLASARTGAVRLDRKPERWQRLTSDLRLPPNTDFLMIHLLIHNDPRSNAPAAFTGHYLDDVRLTLRQVP